MHTTDTRQCLDGNFGIVIPDEVWESCRTEMVVFQEIASSAKVIRLEHEKNHLGDDVLRKLAIEKLEARIARENVGGGGRSRTYDAADMSRVL